jgi:hypothetical protein
MSRLEAAFPSESWLRAGLLEFDLMLDLVKPLVGAFVHAECWVEERGTARVRWSSI